MKATILGCGGSGGVPLAGRERGGHWGACDPSEPRNRRRRASLLVEAGGTTILVDASPDLRCQMLNHDITRIDGVLFTHAHGDHCHGIDELRSLVYARGGAIPAYMDRVTWKRLTQRFDYAFTSSRDPVSGYAALLDDRVLDGPVELGEITVWPFRQGHGPGETSLGFRFGDLAYSTDVVALDEAAFQVLEGTRVWIVDSLREDPHPTHSHHAQTLSWIDRVGPARAILTHMNHSVDYRTLADRCPAGVEPAYDGMVIEL